MNSKAVFVTQTFSYTCWLSHDFSDQYEGFLKSTQRGFISFHYTIFCNMSFKRMQLLHNSRTGCTFIDFSQLSFTTLFYYNHTCLNALC